MVLVVALAVVIMVRPRELNFLRLLPFILPLLILSMIFASRTSDGMKSVLVPFPILMTAGYFVTTTVWSAVPGLSIAESLVICSIAATASLVSSFCTLREFVGGVLAGCLAVFIASAAAGVVMPSYGLVPDGYQAGSLRGIMLDRNSLAFVLVLGLVATLAYEFRGRSPRAQKMVLVVLFVGGVLWSTSSTCLILSAVACLLAAELALFRRVPVSRRGWAAVTGALLTALAGVYVSSNFASLLQLVDRDPSLTGRTRIWPAVENMIAQNPWLGQGWGGVWGNWPLREQLARSIGFDVPHAHNGYLDIRLQVGAVGLGLILLLLLLIGLYGVANYLRSDSSLSSWAPLLAVVLVLYNRVETSFPAPATMFLMFATLVVLIRSRRSNPSDDGTSELSGSIVQIRRCQSE